MLKGASIELVVQARLQFTFETQLISIQNFSK